MSHLGPQEKTDTVSKNKLLAAALKVDEREIRYLVDHERIPLTSTDVAGQTVAHVAAAKRNLQLLQYVVFREPSLVSVTDRWKQTPLHLAVEKGALDIVEYLVDYCNADLLQRCGLKTGNNALHVAAEAGQLAMLRYLIETKSMDPNERNDEGQSAVHLAARVDHLHIIEYLAEHTNANLTAVDNDGRNILFMSAKVLYGSLRVPKYVLDQKKLPIDVNWRDRRGLTVTHFACRFFHLPTIMYYVDVKRADINIPDNRNRTALHLASSLHNQRLVEFLIHHGIDPTVKDITGKTALQVATDPTIVQFLKENAAQRRTRRSFVKPSFESLSFSTQQLASRAFGQEKSISRRSTHLDKDGCVQLAGANSILLLLANALLKPKNRDAASSRREFLQSRADPIAIDIIHSNSFS